VLRYRRWLDAHGASLPSYRGLATSRNGEAAGKAQSSDRGTLHTRICASCSRAERLAGRAERTLTAAAFVFLALGVLAAGSAGATAAVVAALGAALGGFAARRVAARFR
jgi:hypothetical protein